MSEKTIEVRSDCIESVAEGNFYLNGIAPYHGWDKLYRITIAEIEEAPKGVQAKESPNA